MTPGLTHLHGVPYGLGPVAAELLLDALQALAGALKLRFAHDILFFSQDLKQWVSVSEHFGSEISITQDPNIHLIQKLNMYVA